MKYTDNYVKQYESLLQKKEYVLNALKFIFTSMLQEFMHSDVYDRLQFMSIVNNTVEIKDLGDKFSFLHIDNIYLIEHEDNTIDFNVTLSTKVLNQNIDTFVSYIRSVLTGLTCENLEKAVYYNISFKEDCKYISVDYSMLYVFGYRKMDISTFLIRNKPYYVVFKYELLMDSNTLYVDNDLIKDSVLVLYYTDLVQFYKSLDSLFFCYYTKKLLLHVAIDTISDTDLLSMLDKIKQVSEDANSSLNNMAVYFSINRITGWNRFKLGMKVMQLRNYGVKVYFKADYIDM